MTFQGTCAAAHRAGPCGCSPESGGTLNEEVLAQQALVSIPMRPSLQNDPAPGSGLKSVGERAQEVDLSGMGEAEQLTGGDGDAAEQLAQLLIVADSQLDVAGDNPGLLVVAGSVSSQLENLSCQVLQDCTL